MQKLIEGAKREGQVVLISKHNRDTGPALANAFKNWAGLPADFKVDVILLNSGPLVQRVTEELKAGKLTIDGGQLATIEFWRKLKNEGHLMEWTSPILSIKRFSRSYYKSFK